MTLTLAIVLSTRILLCALFLPFSALDKVLNFDGAVAQARQVVPSRAAAAALDPGRSVRRGVHVARRHHGHRRPRLRPGAGRLLRGDGDRLEAVLEAG